MSSLPARIKKTKSKPRGLKWPQLFPGARIAQLGERRSLDHKVAGLILTRGAVLCS